MTSTYNRRGVFKLVPLQVFVVIPRLLRRGPLFAAGFLESLPHMASKLKDPNSRAKERKFAVVVKEVQAATVLILVGSHDQ